jgi:fumarate reductase subunit D
MTAWLLAHRANALWLAALVHRLSGLALAAFLPLHFLTLGLAIQGDAQLDSFLRWSDRPIVKLSESVLVFLLAIHLLGGLRLLALENLGWLNGQKLLAVLAVAAAALAAFAFLAQVF